MTDKERELKNLMRWRMLCLIQIIPVALVMTVCACMMLWLAALANFISLIINVIALHKLNHAIRLNR